MGRFICPDCKTTLVQKIDHFGQRLWCPKCNKSLTTIASERAKRRRN